MRSTGGVSRRLARSLGLSWIRGFAVWAFGYNCGGSTFWLGLVAKGCIRATVLLPLFVPLLLLAKRREKLSRALGKSALKSFHPRWGFPAARVKVSEPLCGVLPQGIWIG